MLDTCFLLVKLSSTCCFGPLSRFARGFPRVALGTSAGSRRCCVTSPGSRVGITELMLVLRCDESVVTLLVLRCYGFGTVLDFFRWLVSRRESSGPASRSTLGALEGEVRESRSTREGELHAGALF